MHKLEYNQIPNISEPLIFINVFIQYNPLLALRTQLQGSAHTAVNSTRPPHTQLWSLYLLLQPKTQASRPRAIITIKIP